ncbi:ABC transporter ATP-binding protein/permease [Pukyongiella litopenaei]|uniref:ABC transporter ATP-binding protein/permease n=1 Tax=Pukyongiella litopenaei TaxID=2605946 RepID=A0A2S0MQ04_9RHOB|nr:ABC transporter ATP-binding protein/permease [Pukyongiella litopenaei]AVO37948.1 ABC transporter ATP-binding protein/permease [Pukyongiella litopenaei]
MNTLSGGIFRLIGRAALGPRAWIGLALYAVVLGLEFLGVWVSVQMISWTRVFYDALEQFDVAAAVAQLWVFAGLVGLWAGAALFGQWVRDRLLLFWRERLTDAALQLWLGKAAYWHLRPGLSPAAVDNPDQRVAEDCRNFIRLLLVVSVDVITNIVALVSYVAILWNISDFALEFELFGADVSIPRYMVWLAFIYVAGSTLITHLLGKPLKGLVFRQERREADFRHALVQIRDNATEIAQSRGEEAERKRLDRRFLAIKDNWNRLIGREFILGLFTKPYYRSILRVPLFFALPAYFARSVSFGGLMQLASAFSSVATTLSWFIFNYRDLAEIAAVAQRLDDLFVNTADPKPLPGIPRAIRRRRSTGAGMSVDGLRLYTPDGKALAPVPDIRVEAGEHIWISGFSGVGKTTLLSALSGLWPYGEGAIDMPAAGLLALPQVPRVFNESLAAAICYPSDPSDVPETRLTEILMRVGMPHCLDRLALDGSEAVEGLSMGERQRLAIARLLIHEPTFVLLDEATSALDIEAEAELFALLREDLPNATILCVAHRPPEALAPYRTWTIGHRTRIERKSA